jgi:uncharacterized beta-barrel protein YwiB (DUF1934 family)
LILNNMNAIITIKNRQQIDGQRDDIEVMTEGSFYDKNGTYYILYTEGEEGVSTRIKASRQTVSIRKSGAYSSDFLYETGRTHSFVYRMPYGEIAMELNTQKVYIELSETGGTIVLDYILEMNLQKIENHLTISVQLRK